MKEFGLTPESLEGKKVELEGVLRGLSKRSYETYINAGREPHNSSKETIVRVIRSMREELSGLTVPDLERENFDPKYLVRVVPMSMEERFSDEAVDLMITQIADIVETATTIPLLMNRLSKFPYEGAKKEFWKYVRKLERELAFEDGELDAALHESGIPPKLLANVDYNTRAYAKEIMCNPQILSKEQRLLWNFCTTM